MCDGSGDCGGVVRVPVEVVACVAWASRGIGRAGSLLFNLAHDLAHFKRLTSVSGSAVVMGRATFASIPPQFRPLPNRLNVVLSSSASFHTDVAQQYRSDQVLVDSSLASAVARLQDMPHVRRIFVIGGERLYNAALQLPYTSVLHITRVLTEPQHGSDRFFPVIDTSVYQEVTVSEPLSESGVHYEFVTFVRRPPLAVAPAPAMPPRHAEHQYLDLIRNAMENGVSRGDRTGVGTKAVFGPQMRFDLRNDVFPLLTTKRVFWRGLAEELLWFVSGSTSARLLQQKNVHIWDANGSREFLDQLGFHDRQEGDLGPVYGFQWRHFGATYKDMDTDYSGQGVDQLQQVIDLIRRNPESRRIILSAWNPAALNEMALPPCHMFAQFFVVNGELSCLMYQRSCDLGLGVPFNIASYALLTRMLAHVCGLKAGDFIHTLGDAHVYNNHIEPLKQQLQRQPRPFPTLKISPDVRSIDEFTLDDFTLVGYNPHPTIKMDMAV